MKDKLSSLLRFSKESRKCESVEGVLRTWQPLLEALSAKKCVTEVDFLSRLLFESLNNETEWVQVAVSERVEAEESESAEKPKNRLDSLNDDVLSHCISFLGYGDVLNSVERVCHRMFHVSRSIKKPFKCEAFDEIICEHWDDDNAKAYMKDMILAAKRFESEQLDAAKILSFGSFRVDALAANFVDTLTTLKFDYDSIAVTTLTFPELTHIHTIDVDSTTVKAFVSRNPTVRMWTVRDDINCSVLNAEFYADLNEMQNVSEIEFRFRFGNERDAANNPLLKSAMAKAVTSCKLTTDHNVEFIRPFLHSKLRRLSLTQTPNHLTTRTPFALESLEALDIRRMHSLAGCNCLQTNPFKLKRLRADHIFADALVPLFQKYPLGALQFGIVKNYQLLHSDAIDDANEALDSANWDYIKPKSVYIMLQFAIDDNHTLDFLRLLDKVCSLLPDTHFTLTWYKPTEFATTDAQNVENEIANHPNVILRPVLKVPRKLDNSCF